MQHPLNVQIRVARENRGWSREDLAYHVRRLTGVKVSLRTLQRMETEPGHRLYFDKVVAVCSVLHLRPEGFKRWEQPRRAEKSA